MPLTTMDRLTDGAYAWIFPITPALDGGQSAEFLGEIDRFLEGWAAHNVPITAARELIDGSFLVIAAAEDRERSGCSVDRLFGLMRAAESHFGVSILDPQRVFFRGNDGRPRAATRAEFRSLASPSTIVYDTLAETVGDIRAGRWMRPAAESWHARLLG